MSDELRAAAERVRRLGAGENYSSVYGCEMTMGGHMQRDERKIVDAYLALFRADDEQPIDETWLRSVGGKRPMTPARDTCLVLGCFRTGACPPDGIYPISYYKTPKGEPNWMVFGNVIKSPETRGDLRLLARALGITLKEPNDDE